MKTRILEYTNRLKRFFRNDRVEHLSDIATAPEYNIPEILPINCRPSEFGAIRLNLLVPALSLRYSFGGINTALDFFIKLLADQPDARIIITDEASSDLLGFSQSAEWQLLKSEDEDKAGRIILCFGDRYNKTIPIRRNDVFIATAWWTAYNGERILSWQRERWKEDPLPLVYLVQDFEPGFYKWSSRYLLSLSTYYQKNMIAVINTSLLSDYIKFTGITLKHYYIFEPTLNKNLAKALPQKANRPKKKQIIVYGRPSVERNGYEVMMKGLEYWSFWHPNATSWEVVSLGEFYPDVKLGNGITVKVKGKLTIEEYASMLLDSAIGISLMISPHPSYPPLEMAAFDLGVITNKFYNKNLSDFHDNFFSLENINPENIALLLGDLCSRFEDRETVFSGNNFRNMDFISDKNSFDLIDDLKLHLQRKEE